MIRKGSLVCYIGPPRHRLVKWKTYSVHDVKEGYAWLWVRNDKNWTKRQVPLDEIKLVVE